MEGRRSPSDRLTDTEGHEALECMAISVDHPERRVARPRQLGRNPDQGLEDGVEGQLRGDRDSGLDEPPASLIAVHISYSTWLAARAVPGVQADFNAMPPVPKPPTAKSGRNRNLVIALAVAAVVVAAALIAPACCAQADDGSDSAATTATPTPRQRPDTTTPEAATPALSLVAGIPQNGTVLGEAGTTVRMLQFEDLQCPICKRYTDEAFPAIVNEYVRTGRIKIDFRGLAFLGPDSLKALKIAMAAGLQNKLWQVVGLFYENQGDRELGLGDRLADRPDPRGRARSRRRQGQGRREEPEGRAIRSRQFRPRRRSWDVQGTPWFYLAVGFNPPVNFQPGSFRPE